MACTALACTSSTGGHCSSSCAVHGRDISACHTRCQVITVKQSAAAGCSVDLAAVRAVGQCSACSGARRAGLPAAAAADALLQHAGHTAVHQAAVPRAAGRGAAEARGHDRLAGGHGFGRACVCTHACARHNDRSHVHMCWYVLLYAAAVVIIQLAVSDLQPPNWPQSGHAFPALQPDKECVGSGKTG